MSLTPKKLAFFILGITAIVCSRTLFFFFNDPEGPNLLVVVVAAALIYLASLAVYAFRFPANDSQKFWIAISMQLLLAMGLYYLGVTF